MKIGLITFFILASFIVGVYFYNDWYHKDIHSKPEVYVNVNYRGVTDPVLFIDNLNYKEEYLNFYNKLLSGKKATFNFPVKSFPANHQVYLIGYTPDSLLAEIACYYDFGKDGDWFTTGFVIPSAVHPIE